MKKICRTDLTAHGPPCKGVVRRRISTEAAHSRHAHNRTFPPCRICDLTGLGNGTEVGAGAARRGPFAADKKTAGAAADAARSEIAESVFCHKLSRTSE